jgi:hypothetical protein
VVEKRGGTVLLENEIERGCLGSSRAQALELKLAHFDRDQKLQILSPPKLDLKSLRAILISSTEFNAFR